MALEGNFLDMSLCDLLHIFRSGCKSGVLIIAAEPERGMVYVYKGELLDAVIISENRQVRATADEAVIAMLHWASAQFVFRHDPAVAERPRRMTHDAEWLVLEAIRRREDSQGVCSHPQLHMDSRLELSAMSNGAESGVNLNLKQWRMLSQVAICETLGDICERVGYSAEEGMQVATALLAVGLIELVAPAKPLLAPNAVNPAMRLPTPVQRVPSLVLAHVTAGGSGRPGGESTRGLLGAIMRRIRGL